ncbi:MAG TPA: chitobiase, partial [Prevotella sp.]|nr:chitobiase [Candidatus Segatella violae]
MMKKYILCAAVALLAMTGCTDSDYTLDKLVPSEYHKIMLIKDSGKHNKTLLDIEDDDVTSITIQKLGSDPTL